MYNQVLYLEGAYLDPIISILGLKLSGVLSPLLFNLFIDDMKLIYGETCDPIKLFDKRLSHLLYADDLMLLSTSAKGLNKCLKCLQEYCLKWQLEIKIKSKVIIFNPTGKKLSGQNIWINGVNLEVDQSYCYLGIEVSCSGSFTIWM